MTKDTLISVVTAIGQLTNEGIMLFDVETSRLEYCNDSLAKLFDISHSTFRTQPAFFINHIVPDDIDYLGSEREKLLRERRVEEVEFRVRQHDGKLVNVTGSCYLLENGKYIIGLFRDITGMREHENYIINYGAKKNTLLDMVTHNLTGPLTISQKMLDSLETMVKKADVNELNVHIQLIKENTRHCIDVVNEFLEEEHMVSEQIHPKKNRFDVLGKIRAILERFRKGYPDYDFLLLKNIETLYINSDDVKFLQVMNNLISNAIKWSPTESVIEIRVADAPDHVMVSVRDHGVGIPDEMKRHIFQRSTPASRIGLRGEASLGMGLYIVSKLVSLMNGSISFESNEGHGTTFTLHLPKNGGK